MTKQISLFETESKPIEPEQPAFQKFVRKLIKEGYIESRRKVNGQLIQTFKKGK